MKFTKKTDYALRTMQFLGRKHMHALAEGLPFTPVAVSSIAEASHLSARFLHGIVSKLAKAGLLKAISGPKGGVLLARKPEAITILDIVEAVEGRIHLMECLKHPGHCSDAGGCSILSILHTAQAAMVNTLKNSNLKLMVSAQHDPFGRLPEQHFLKPKFGCPVLK